MTAQIDKLVVVVTRGIESELSSVAFTLANGGLSAGMTVYVFLTSTGIDLVRRNGHAMTHVPPLDSMEQLVRDFLARGGVVWACPPCVKSRGYTQSDLIDGVVIAGGSAMLPQLKDGAATLCF